MEHEGCETSDIEAFTSFIQRHARELGDDLWDFDTPSHQELQKYLLVTTELSNETLEVLFMNVVLSDPVILKGLQSRERWEMLATAPFLAFSPEIRECISAFSADLEAPYLAAHWVQARDHIDLSHLSIDMAIPLSKSGALELKEKIQMWAALPVEAFDTNNEAIKEVAETCRVANRHSVSFPTSFIPALKKFAGEEGLSPAQRSEVLIQCLPSFSWSEAASVLAMLTEAGFTKLSPHVKKIEVPHTDLNMRLVNALQTRGFLQTVTEKGDDISATAKPKGMI